MHFGQKDVILTLGEVKCLYANHIYLVRNNDLLESVNYWAALRSEQEGAGHARSAKQKHFPRQGACWNVQGGKQL